MWVRKLSGKQTGLLIEMADHAAEAEIATGVAERAESPEPENDLLAELLEAEASEGVPANVTPAEIQKAIDKVAELKQNEEASGGSEPPADETTKRRRKSAL